MEDPKPPESVEEGLYSFDEEKLLSKKTDTLPSSLYEAIIDMKKNRLVQTVFGELLYI